MSQPRPSFQFAAWACVGSVKKSSDDWVKGCYVSSETVFEDGKQLDTNEVGLLILEQDTLSTMAKNLSLITLNYDK
jgi:hypothetical protein